MLSIAIGFEFDYNGRRYQHIFWSLSDLQNYFRWEPERGQLVAFTETIASENKRSSNGILKLIAMGDHGQRRKEVAFNTYQDMVGFIELKSIRIRKVSKLF